MGALSLHHAEWGNQRMNREQLLELAEALAGPPLHGESRCQRYPAGRR